MVIYLPLSFLKDFIYNSIRRHSGSTGASKITSKSSFGGSAPLKNGELKMLEMESQKTIVIPVVEETKPLIYGITEINDGALKEKQLSTKEIATYGLYLCPLWFVTEVTFQRPYI
jgi:solute carrier family 35 protein F5